MNMPRAIPFLALLLSVNGCGTTGRDHVGGTDGSADRGLVAHWTFDEGSGDIAKDVTGNGHDAALKNVEWAPSPRGFALRFDSKEDSARYGQVDTMNMSGDVTLAVWVKTDAAAAPRTHRLIFGDGGGGVERNLHLSMDSYDRLSFEWADGKTNASLLAPASLLDGVWRHVTVVADSQARQATMYVDGVKVAAMAMPLPISKAPVKERLTGWFYSGYFQGDLDDIRLYNRALTEDEVQRLFESQADVQVGRPTVLFDAGQSDARGLVSVRIHNWSAAPRRLELTTPAAAKQEITLASGAETEVALGTVALRPVWRGRNDLFVCEQSQEAGSASVLIHRGEQVERAPIGRVSQPALEPVQAQVEDPWQRQMASGKTERLELDVRLAIPAEQLRKGALQISLVSRETGKEVLSRELKSPQARQPLTLDVRALPWGAYDVTVSFRDASSKNRASTKRTATVLPGGKQQVRVLNNLVSELMDARGRSLLGNRRIEFMNPRHGWVWFRAAGACTLRLGNDPLLAAEDGKPAAEAMRLLPAGKHALDIAGTPTDLTVRAIPALVYNVYPSTPQIAPFGSNSWERLKKHTLPNTNMIESSVADAPEHDEWMAQGKLWVANVQAPGLIDKKDWTAETMLAVWRNPGKSTAWAERPGLSLAKLSGMQVDEYYAGALSPQNLTITATSIAQLAEDPAFAGKLWIPFMAGRYGTNAAAELFTKTVLGAGWPFSEEVYVGEMPTEAENLKNIRSSFLNVALGYENACPGSLRRMIFTPMYAYLPYCTANRYPQADFRVHLDMQMQMLASDPAFFGLWGVQPYRSNYVDEEILNCMGMMLRHYCIEGKTERMLSDPYELRHAADPDFEEGLAHWQIAAAEGGSIAAGKFAGYGQLQGRYPGGPFGDAFLLMKRSAKAANVASQQLQGLEKGRLYSLKLITGDHADLVAGKTRKDQQSISIRVDGAEALDSGFSYPFHSCRGPKSFTTKDPFWMTYHWLQFRAKGPTAQLSISDWAKPDSPGGPIGQEVMFSFLEVQPVLESAVSQAEPKAQEKR